MGGVRKCSAPDCKINARDNPEIKLFTFPTNKERCCMWVSNTKREDWKGKSINQVVSSHYICLCSNHFEEDQFMNSTRKQLVYNAVPTLFNSSLNKNHANKTSLSGRHLPTKEKTFNRDGPRKKLPKLDQHSKIYLDDSHKKIEVSTEEAAVHQYDTELETSTKLKMTERRINNLEEELRNTKEALLNANTTIQQLKNQIFICGTLVVDMN